MYKKRTIKKWFSFIKLEKLSVKSQEAIQSFDAYVKKITFDCALKLFLFAINNEINSLRHLDTLVETIWSKEGVLGARMTGAGMGGCAIVIVNQSKVKEVIDDI